MTDSGPPPSVPGEPLSSTAGPRPRVGAGDVNATALPRSGGVLPPGEPPATPDFWPDDDTPEPTPRSRAQSKTQHQIRTTMEWIGVAIGALIVALLIKAFLLQAFYIPSASMEPTLHRDDRVLVNKLSYRIGDVHRGDVIVFHKPENASGDIDDFIKRVIGLGGETVSLSDGNVFIDGDELIEDYVDGAASASGAIIPGCDNEPAVADNCRVPDGMVFVMGDNRGSSQDSRVFGPIPEDTIVGRAFLKVWPLGDIGFL